MAHDSKRKQRKQEKKRRMKRAKRAEHANQFEVLPYSGNKYRTAALLEWLMDAELAIYETFVLLDRQLTDHEVIGGLKNLILELRHGPLAEIDSGKIEGTTEEIVAWSVRRWWHQRRAKQPQPSRDSLVGVLRSILGSVDVWKSISHESQGYLQYLEKFVTEKLGFQVEVRPGPEEDENDDLFEEDRLDDEEDFGEGDAGHNNDDLLDVPRPPRIFPK